MSSRKGVDQKTDGVAAVNLGPKEGSWKVSGRRSRNKAGNYNKMQAQQNNVPQGSCAQPPPRGSRGNVRPQLPSGRGFPINPAFAAPLDHNLRYIARNARPVKATLKHELKSYQEKVVNGLKQTSEENQKMAYFKDKLAREKKRCPTIKEMNVILAEMVRKKDEENCIVRQRSKVQFEEYKQQMDYIEEFYKNQLKLMYDKMAENEESLEMSHQEERQKVKQSKERENEIENFIKSQNKNTEVFVGEKDNLMKIHEEKKAALKKKYYEEKVELENEIDAQLTYLMDEFSPQYHSKSKGTKEIIGGT